MNTLPATCCSPEQPRPATPVVATATEGVLVIDPQGRIVMADAPAAALLGRDHAGLAGRCIGECLSAESTAALRQALAHGAGAAPPEDLWLTPAGGATTQRLQVALTTALCRDSAGGQQSGACLRLRRPLAGDAAGEQIASLRARQMQLFDQTPTAAIVCRGATIAYANRRALALFGAAGLDALVGRQCHDLVAPEVRPALDQHIALAMAGDPELPMLLLTLECLDGGQRQAEIVVAALPGYGDTLTLALLHDVTRHNGERLALERSRAELRNLSGSLVEAREEERRRIARELHDDLGQRLSWMKMELSDIAGHGSRPAARARMAALLELLDETMASLRRISADMRPLMLDDLGLQAALEWLGRETTRRVGLEVAIKVGELQPTPDDRTATAVYRIVQEALNNVGRHARATDARVLIAQEGGELALTVQDNGQGFPAGASSKAGSFGLMGIRERALLLGGRLEVDNPPGGGGRLRVWLPLDAAPDAENPVPAAPETGATATPMVRA